MSIRCLISVGFALFAFASSARAQNEPNNTCATASVIGPGTYTNLSSLDDYVVFGCCSSTDFDYYRITIPPGDRLQFTTTRTGSTGHPGDLWTTFREATAGCPGVYSGQTITNTGTLVVANTGATPHDMVVEVRAWVFQKGWIDVAYNLGVVLVPDACPNAVDDGFETPIGQQSTPIGFGTLSNLFARYFDDDVYSLSLPQGTTVSVRIDLQHAQGDLDLTVFDSSISLSSTSLTNQEQVTFTRTLPSGQGPVFVRVAPKPNAVSVCNHYALTVDVIAPALGTNYCLAAVNSYGMEAHILPEGSSSISANDLRFTCQAFSAANPCLLVAGTQPAQMPFGDGWLCVGGSLVRLKITFASNGLAVLIPDFTTVPGNAITPGATWNYQVFYRDTATPPGSGFNLTNGVAIAMTP